MSLKDRLIDRNIRIRLAREHWMFILAVLFGLSLFWNVRQCEKLHERPVVLEDSLHYWKDKAGREYAEKTAAILTAKELRRSNDSLYAEYKALKDRGPVVITKTETVTEIRDTVISTEVERYPGGYNIKWGMRQDYSGSNWVALGGVTTADSLMTAVKTRLDSLQIGADMILSVTDGDKDRVRINVRSNNPLLRVTDVAGAMLDPNLSKSITSRIRKKKFGLGLHFGPGLQAAPDGTVRLGIEAGVGINFNLIQF